ncbi:MAG TPA: LamG domain-containing protein [Gemmataceae bacterium]|nr:LamG domain-containing protein [Gemmataceae bacterium]
MSKISWRGCGLAAIALWLAVPALSQADIIHRYSFTNDASDSVGGEDGILMGNAAITSDGQVALDGTAGTYVQLPIGDTLAALSNCSFETWVTWDHSPGQSWSRIFDFGTSPTTNMFFTPQNGSNLVPRFALTVGGAGAEQQVQAAPAFPVQVETHVVVTIDADNQIASLYVNGQVNTVVYGYTNSPAAMGFTNNNYLGKSQYNDPYFNGTINEFRIYDRPLSAAEVAADFNAGPNGTPP